MEHVLEYHYEPLHIHTRNTFVRHMLGALAPSSKHGNHAQSDFSANSGRLSQTNNYEATLDPTTAISAAYEVNDS